MKSYPLGCELVLGNHFVDAITGLPADPTTVVLELADPTGTVVTPPSVSHPSTGVYKALYTPMMAGVWTVRWEGTGAVVAASEFRFEVRPSAFAS